MTPTRSRLLQGALVVAVAATLAGLALTARENLLRQNIATGFGFLFGRTGWDVGTSFFTQSAADPYWWTFLAGIGNTLVLSLVCIVLATALGLVLAFAASGRSRILHALARTYVGVFRNIPIIVQMFFWYHVTRILPPVRQALELPGCCFASNRGIYLPQLDASVGLAGAVATAATGLAAAGALRWVARRREARGDAPLGRAVRVAAILAAMAVVAAATFDVRITAPRLQGFNFVGGMHLSPEFVALVLAITAYNVAFVAEIVESGIRAIPRSQLEAARVIGLADATIFWRITVPQAIRVAVPPLINQYISITKSSSLAIAIGYTDLFSVGVIAINHTGQSIDVIAVLMATYLLISLCIAALGNAYNRSIRARGAR